MSTYGYIRVSSADQCEDRQRIALQVVCVPEENIYLDKQSGKDFDRPAYKRMVRKIKKTICSISRASIVWGEIMRRSKISGDF